MNLFIETHQQWLKEMLAAHVDFIVIGGYSVIYHGYKRTTGDMDIWLKPDNSNRDKLIPLLTEYGFDRDTIAQISAFDFSQTLSFSIDESPGKIDFLTHINLVNNEEADKLKVIAEIDGLHIPFLHFNHLILSKMNTGRTKDKADIEMLQQVAAANKKL